MIKLLLALLLIAGILTAAHIGEASGNENVVAANTKQQVWWHKNFGQFLSARPLSEVPWLNHVSRVNSDLPLGPKVDTFEPFRLRFANPSAQVTSSGQFSSQ